MSAISEVSAVSVWVCSSVLDLRYVAGDVFIKVKTTGITCAQDSQGIT